ncbi:hypothetical protein [Clostridium ganghwense]|uniref:SMI1/KNR4 family protein n=1 Tax=Clostridium ganghwense TaxID=312089 RepID=A0ABT4CN77_9CLOT|nr:hypothetical protein [Clostridium ganghwense]MCY6369449.1 hypothetical protein [Clostridium ganghwense]
MSKFEFYDRFEELEGEKGIKAGDKRIEKLVDSSETCLGHRIVEDRNYHIFYLNSSRFALYYHGGGVDAMYSTPSLDEMLDYVNSL